MYQEREFQAKHITPAPLLWEERLKKPARHPARARVLHFARWSARLVSRRLAGIGGVVLGLPLVPLSVSLAFSGYREPFIVAACVLGAVSVLILALLYIESRMRSFRQELANILNELSRTPGMTSAQLIEQLRLEIRRIDPMDARLDRLISDFDRLAGYHKRFAACEERLAELAAQVRELEMHIHDDA